MDNAVEITKDMQKAAEDLIDSLYCTINGRAVRSAEEVWQALSTPIRQRRQFITKLASNYPYYSVQQWHDWYALWQLSETHMDDAVWQWKREFPMNQRTRDKIQKLEEEDTKKSRADAKDSRNSAFAAYLRNTSIHKQLAMACLKSPSATVHTLLENGYYTCTLQSMKERRPAPEKLKKRMKRR